MPTGVRNLLVLWTPESLGAGSTFPGCKNAARLWLGRAAAREKNDILRAGLSCILRLGAPLWGYRVWDPFGEPHRAQHLFITLCASCLSELINFGQSQSEFSQENTRKVSRQLGWGASSPRPPWTGRCWWVLL